jgi:hypothetical protein
VPAVFDERRVPVGLPMMQVLPPPSFVKKQAKPPEQAKPPVPRKHRT